jgi:hypothetical protein
LTAESLTGWDRDVSDRSEDIGKLETQEVYILFVDPVEHRLHLCRETFG